MRYLLILNDFFSLGPIVEYVGESKLPYGNIPILLYAGEVTLQSQSGRLATQVLDTHSALIGEEIEDHVGPDQVNIRHKTPSVYSIQFIAL